MTWAEAKEKSGIGTGSSSSNKVKTQVGKSHAAVLAAKILSKNGPDENERVRDRQAARQAKKDQQRQVQLNAQRETEKEQQRLGEVMIPHEKAMERLQQLTNEYRIRQSTPLLSLPLPKSIEQDGKDYVQLICESKQMQLDEIIALQAIYADTDNLSLPDHNIFSNSGSPLETLQATLDKWHLDQNNEALRRSVVDQPTVSFTLKRSMHDPEGCNDDDNDGGDFVAHMLFHISFPSDYPLRTTPPIIQVVWFLLTQKSMTVAANKPLDSSNMGTLDERGLAQAMTDYAQEFLLGMPSVYALLDTWLSDHLFKYITRNVT